MVDQFWIERFLQLTRPDKDEHDEFLWCGTFPGTVPKPLHGVEKLKALAPQVRTHP